MKGFVAIEMLKRTLSIAVLLGLAALALWAATSDLRPDGDVATAWADGTGSTFAEINDDVDSPTDSSYIQCDGCNGDVSRFTFGNTPGDCGTINSLTFAIRHERLGVVDDNDNFDVRVYITAGQTGGTKSPTMSDAGLTTSTETDAAWDALSCGEANTLEFDVIYNKASSGMPDGVSLRVSEVEFRLDYNISTGNTRAIVIGSD